MTSPLLRSPSSVPDISSTNDHKEHKDLEEEPTPASLGLLIPVLPGGAFRTRAWLIHLGVVFLVIRVVQIHGVDLDNVVVIAEFSCF